MPIYTFRCPKCKHEFSGIFSMKDSDGKKLACPKCDNRGVKRIYKNSASLVTESGSSSCPGGVCPLS